MINTADDLLDYIEEDGVYSESAEGWLNYWIDRDYVLHVKFERDIPREHLSGKWKLVPIDEQ